METHLTGPCGHVSSPTQETVWYECLWLTWRSVPGLSIPSAKPTLFQTSSKSWHFMGFPGLCMRILCFRGFLHPVCFPHLGELQSFQPTCHRPKELSLYLHVFLKLFLVTLVIACLFSFYLSPSKQKNTLQNKKAFLNLALPLNKLIHRDVDWHNLGQRGRGRGGGGGREEREEVGQKSPSLQRQGRNCNQRAHFMKLITGTILIVSSPATKTEANKGSGLSSLPKPHQILHHNMRSHTQLYSCTCNRCWQNAHMGPSDPGPIWFKCWHLV